MSAARFLGPLYIKNIVKDDPVDLDPIGHFAFFFFMFIYGFIWRDFILTANVASAAFITCGVLTLAIFLCFKPDRTIYLRTYALLVIFPGLWICLLLFGITKLLFKYKHNFNTFMS